MRYTIPQIHQAAIALAQLYEDAETQSFVLVDMTKPDDVSAPVDIKPPNPVVVGDTINGHSRAADAEGFATVPSWPALFNATIAEHERQNGPVKAALLQEIWGKSPKRLRCESVRQNCDFPSVEAKLACDYDMGSRLSVAIILGDNTGTHDAILVRVTEKPEAPALNYNIRPEDQAHGRYDYARERVLVKANWREAAPAWCFNFDPARDVAYANKLYVAFILAELAPKDPIDG